VQSATESTEGDEENGADYTDTWKAICDDQDVLSVSSSIVDSACTARKESEGYAYCFSTATKF